MNTVLPDSILTRPEQMPLPAAELPALPAAPSAKKSRANLLLIVGPLVLGLCLCAGLGGAVFGAGMYKIKTEWPKVESVIDEFMGAMADKDAGEAYALFSTRAKRYVSQSDLERMLGDNGYVIFDGYQKVTITNLNLRLDLNSDPGVPQGSVAEVEGLVTYDGGFTGTFNAVLEQEGGAWRLDNINVVVPPAKFAANP